MTASVTNSEPATSGPVRWRPRRRVVFVAVAAIAVLAVAGWVGYRLTRIDVGNGNYGASMCADVTSKNPDGMRIVTTTGIVYGLGVFTVGQPGRITFDGVTPVGVRGSIVVERAILVPSAGSVGNAWSLSEAGVTDIMQQLAVTPGQPIYTVPKPARGQLNEAGTKWQLVVVLRTTQPAAFNQLHGFKVHFSAPWHFDRTVDVSDPVALDGRPGVVACSNFD